jgi:hypothetical protein
MRSLGLFTSQSGLLDLDQSQLLPSVGIRIYPRYSFFTIKSAAIKASKMPHEVTTYAMLSLTGINTCNHRLFHFHNQIVVLIWTYVAACLVDVANSHRLFGGDIKGLTPSLRCPAPNADLETSRLYTLKVYAIRNSVVSCWGVSPEKLPTKLFLLKSGNFAASVYFSLPRFLPIIRTISAYTLCPSLSLSKMLLAEAQMRRTFVF